MFEYRVRLKVNGKILKEVDVIIEAKKEEEAIRNAEIQFPECAAKSVKQMKSRLN